MSRYNSAEKAKHTLDTFTWTTIFAAIESFEFPLRFLFIQILKGFSFRVTHEQPDSNSKSTLMKWKFRFTSFCFCFFDLRNFKRKSKYGAHIYIKSEHRTISNRVKLLSIFIIHANMISKSEIFHLCLDFSIMEASTSQRFSLLICILFREFEAQCVASAHKITCVSLTMTNAK